MHDGGMADHALAGLVHVPCEHSRRGGVHNKWAGRLQELEYPDAWSDISINHPIYLKYSAHDIRQLRAAHRLVFKAMREIPLIDTETSVHVLYHIMRDRGMRMDPANAADTLGSMEHQAGEFVDNLRAEHGVTSPNSPRSIADALERAGHASEHYTPTGRVSTSKASLADVRYPEQAQRIARGCSCAGSRGRRTRSAPIWLLGPRPRDGARWADIEEAQGIEDKLNWMPRKFHGWQSAADIYTRLSRNHR